MTMKNLTHYFKSPKEEETDPGLKTSLSPVEIVEEKAPSKRKKISLSKKNKKKIKESPENTKLTPENSHYKSVEQNKSVKRSIEKCPSQNNKKRKIEDDLNSSCKKIKTTKSLKVRSKICDKKSKKESDETVNTSLSKESEYPSGNITPKTENEVTIVLENSISCDEPLMKTKRKSRKNLFDDSDEEILTTKPQALPSNDKLENNESSCNAGSRNSLFSYFNKVDKETALKQVKPSKIEVKAIVHSSPNVVNSDRNSIWKKVNLSNKVKKCKTKVHLDDSDTIEVISSEEIIDENNSTTVNVPLEAEQNHKTPPCLQVERTLNKSTPSNVASIFVPKKTNQENKTSNDTSSLKAGGEIPETAKENVEYAKEIKSNKNRKALSKSKDHTKVNLRNDKGKKANNHRNEDNSCFEISQENFVDSDDKSCKPTLKRNGRVTTSSTKKEFSRKLNLPGGRKSPGKTVGESNEAEELTKNRRSSEGELSQKTDLLKVKPTDGEEVTPKKRGSTINGYFSSKGSNPTSGNTSSAQCTKGAKSPWVMKVCLNSASKNQAEYDDEDSQDSMKKEKKEAQTTPQSDALEQVPVVENKADPPVVVIEDDDNSSSGVNEDSANVKRRLLPRSTKNVKKKLVEEEEEEEEVVEVKPQTPKPAVKMWPFFQKGGSNRNKGAPVDEAKLKAKMLFLESGVPEIIKRKVETVKSEVVLGSPAPFPTVSHVVQSDDKTCCISVDSACLPLPPARNDSPPPAVPVWTPLLPLDSAEESEIPVFQRPGNVKAFLEKLKEEEPKTEVKVLYKKLKEYKSKAESDIWTEVYKPTNSADMVGNSENIKKLKTWLETLKNCRKREGSVSSGDEFLNEDSDGDDSSFNNMAVISGPCGCGKTSAVYAVAKELDIKVLEINASCNRSGKRILAEFSESTQSHHVERSQPMNGFFSNQSSGKKKRKKSKIADKLKSEKTSLILVEDADLLFADCDEGFVPALASLAASSKRPIVLVTNQANTPHLDRFNNSKLLRLAFNKPRPNKLGLWLRLVGLVEGVMMPSELVLHLVTASNCDVRQCLLQLQLMVHSNNSEVKDKVSPSSLWWGWPGKHRLSYELPSLLEPEEEELRPEVDKKLVISQLQSVADTTRRLANLDVMSLDSRSECLEDHEDPCPVAWSARWRDSTCLTVPSTSDPCCLEAVWLQQTLANGLGSPHRTGQTPQETRWLSILRQGEQFFMSGIATTSQTSHQSVTCDYLPMLRELGRSEQVRLANYTRRANRFFNYLQGLGIHASKSFRDFMCDAFS